MSKSVGSALPPDVLARFSGADLAQTAGQALVAATTDDLGRPHIALLTYGEVLATAPERLRVAVYQGSATAENLRERRALTLCAIDAAGALYVKARVVTPLDGAAPLASFECAVEDVLVDEPRTDREGGVWLTGGITFGAHAPAQRNADAERLHGALRAAR